MAGDIVLTLKEQGSELSRDKREHGRNQKLKILLLLFGSDILLWMKKTLYFEERAGKEKAGNGLCLRMFL